MKLADSASSTATQEERSASFVSEWFGYRVYPLVADGAAALEAQSSRLCPFLTQITGDRTLCIKSAAASGICTISSRSNGPRQDWLVGPFRAFSPSILVAAADYLFPGRLRSDPLILPAPTLRKGEVRSAIREKLLAGGKCIVYLQNKLGGEISLSRTERSPELSFDVTTVELALVDDQAAVDAFGILEVQTMDFHGSYRAVVKNLDDALRLHAAGFHKTLQQNQEWLRQGIEGPNIANVFKRTFYQMMLKFKIGASDACTGCLLALPKSVWESWQRHLGGPDLAPTESGPYRLTVPGQPLPASPKTWIIVFDIDSQPSNGPSPIVLDKVIATSAEALAYYAFEVAPSAAVSAGGPTASIASQVRRRLAEFWPELATGLASPRRRSRRKRP